MDAKYGRQFCTERFEETLPATVYGIEKYLGSGLVKGIGPVFAKKIVEKFGENTLDIIDETPEELIKSLASEKCGQNGSKPAGRTRKRSKTLCCSFRVTKSALLMPLRFIKPMAKKVFPL